MKTCLICLLSALPVAGGQAAEIDAWQTGDFRWRSSGPLIDVANGLNAADPHVALKDPSVVLHEGRWHLFGTLRKKSGTVCMQYLSFTNWSEANSAARHEVTFTREYHCAPQVFYFTPHRRWYLIHQLADPARTPAFGPNFSTTTKLTDPKSWSPPQPMVTNAPPEPKWLDFWVICDDAKAHLFYTSLDGHMWRRETKLQDFPLGWSEQTLALKGDIFEASHTYKLSGRSQYLTVIEAQAPGRRYYKAYLADRLEGPWQPLADTLARPFAATENVSQTPPWTASISHGELLRAGVDERMEIEPSRLRFVFQGASEQDYRGTGYGGIPWRLGLLEQIP